MKKINFRIIAILLGISGTFWLVLANQNSISMCIPFSSNSFFDEKQQTVKDFLDIKQLQSAYKSFKINNSISNQIITLPRFTILKPSNPINFSGTFSDSPLIFPSTSKYDTRAKTISSSDVRVYSNPNGYLGSQKILSNTQDIISMYNEKYNSRVEFSIGRLSELQKYSFNIYTAQFRNCKVSRLPGSPPNLIGLRPNTIENPLNPAPVPDFVERVTYSSMFSPKNFDKKTTDDDLCTHSFRMDTLKTEAINTKFWYNTRTDGIQAPNGTFISQSYTSDPDSLWNVNTDTVPDFIVSDSRIKKTVFIGDANYKFEGGNGVTVAVLDTGFGMKDLKKFPKYINVKDARDFSAHSDFEYEYSKKFSPQDLDSTESKQFWDDFDVRNLASPYNQSINDGILRGLEAKKILGHGTGIASIIGSISPDATVLPLKICNKFGICRSTAIIRAICYAIRLEEKKNPNDLSKLILNISASSFEPTPALSTIFDYALKKNVKIIVSAGNRKYSQKSKFEKNFDVRYPSVYDSPTFKSKSGIGIPLNGLISVSGVIFQQNDPYYAPWDGSVRGDFVDVAAPAGILKLPDVNGKIESRYRGTSFAAPIITGLVANCVAKGYGKSPVEMQALLNAKGTNIVSEKESLGKDVKLVSVKSCNP
jgi:subtilisin family serine protease